MITKTEHYKLLLKNNLYIFLEKVFATLNSNIEFIKNWHIELICLYLQEVEKGNIRRLIINVPPRSLKSTIVNIAYPAWLLARNPSEKIISGSFNQNLSLENNIKTRAILESEWYGTLFNKSILQNGINTKEYFETIHGGYKKAGTLASPPTGSGGNYIIIDDPHNTKECESQKERENALQTFNTGFITRLDDKKTGKIIIIMQRLHENDLTGHLLNKDKKWTHLKIPAVADKDYIYYYPNSKKIFKTFKEGEYLNENREGKEEIEQLKLDMGQYAFAGQYMQEPSPGCGGIIKIEWIKYYDLLPNMQYRFITADTAMKTKEINDFSVLQCWGYGIDNNCYLIDQIRGKWEAPELKKMTINFWNKHVIVKNGDLRYILIEDKSSGTGLIQSIQREEKLPIKAIKPETDKISRVNSISAYFSSGYVFFEKDAYYNNDLIYEISMFPNANHDDQIDALCYAINDIKLSKNMPPRIRIIE